MKDLKKNVEISKNNENYKNYNSYNNIKSNNISIVKLEIQKNDSENLNLNEKKILFLSKIKKLIEIVFL